MIRLKIPPIGSLCVLLFKIVKRSRKDSLIAKMDSPKTTRESRRWIGDSPKNLRDSPGALRDFLDESRDSLDESRESFDRAGASGILSRASCSGFR
jgi:hypothetical protein